MKKSFSILAAVILIALAGLGTSCSKKEQAAKKELPPSHEKMVQELSKRMQQGKKITVATVNGGRITMDDLVREMNALGPRFMRPGEKPTPEISAEVRKVAIDNLIFRKLAVEEALRQGMKVPPGTVDNTLNELKKRLGPEGYKVYMARMGASESDMRKIISNDRLFQMIAVKEIFDKVKQPDDKQLKEAYRQEKLQMPERFIADDVFFSGNSPDVKKKAEGVLSEIKTHHGNLSKLRAGSFVINKKTVTQREFPNLYAALEKMKPGGVTGVIEAKDGLHILKLKRKEPARRMTFEEAKNSLAQHLKFQAIQKRKEAWEAQMKKKAKIEITMKGGEGIKPAN